MSLKLRDADGVVYTFPSTFDLNDNSVKMRINNQEITFGHGGRDIGDGKIKPKFITVSGFLDAASEAAFQTLYTALATACLKVDQEFLYDDLYFIRVKRISEIRNPFTPGLHNQVNRVTVRMMVEDPRWYSETLSSQTIAITTDPFTALLTNGGSIETHPRFTLQRTNNYEAVYIANLDGQSGAFTYADTGFVGAAGGGTEVILDANFALATRGSTDTRRFFAGSWPLLAAGGNNFQIEGLSGGTVVVAWRDARI